MKFAMPLDINFCWSFDKVIPFKAAGRFAEISGRNNIEAGRNQSERLVGIRRRLQEANNLVSFIPSPIENQFTYILEFW